MDDDFLCIHLVNHKVIPNNQTPKIYALSGGTYQWHTTDQFRARFKSCKHLRGGAGISCFNVIKYF
jgi:hypothetical protein